MSNTKKSDKTQYCTQCNDLIPPGEPYHETGLVICLICWGDP